MLLGFEFEYIVSFELPVQPALEIGSWRLLSCMVDKVTFNLTLYPYPYPNSITYLIQ